MTKTLITAGALALYALGVTAVYAGGCNHSCADGYSYNSEAGKCVKKTVSS